MQTKKFYLVLLICLFEFSDQLPNGFEIEIPHPQSEYSDWFDIFYKTSPVVPLHRSEGKVYFFGKHFRVNVLQAHTFCRIMHMHLLTILSKEENDDVKAILQKNGVTGDFWTSGTRMFDGKSWIWMSTAKPVNYKNWGPGQPNNKNDHCIATTKTTKDFIWNDRNCNCRLFFICEKPMVETVMYVSRKNDADIRKYYRSYFDFY